MPGHVAVLFVIASAIALVTVSLFVYLIHADWPPEALDEQPTQDNGWEW